ncbi:MAG: carboxymuconolactone decarboxylase family protein [Dehalococcoidia bacterium]
MARVRLLQNEEAPAESEEFLRKIEQNGATVLNLYRTLAHSPSTLSNFVKLGNGLFDQAELPPKIREITILRIATLLGSEYELNQHVPIALEAGVTREQIENIHEWAESPHFNKDEKAALGYADQVTINVRVNDRVFRMLRRYFSERSIVELTVAIGYWGMVARVLQSLEVESDANVAGSAAKLFGKR